MFRVLLLVVVVVLATAVTVGAVPAGAQAPAGPQPAAPQALQQVGIFADFNGDGPTDLAVGAPGENFGATAGAGAVSVFFGTVTGTGLPGISSQTLVQDNPETGDQFGAALTAKVLGGDGFFDLVVGAPGENVGATVDAGAANVFSSSGGVLPTVSSQTLLQANVETGDQFGTALDV
jgi:FG-GAP repeat